MKKMILSSILILILIVGCTETNTNLESVIIKKDRLFIDKMMCINYQCISKFKKYPAYVNKFTIKDTEIKNCMLEKGWRLNPKSERIIYECKVTKK